MLVGLNAIAAWIRYEVILCWAAKLLELAQHLTKHDLQMPASQESEGDMSPDLSR